MDNTTGSCYTGGDIAGTFFGTLICGAVVAYIAWQLYKKYWNARKGTHLVVQDPENGKAGEYAFDNPAFKTDGTKVQSSPLDTKWMGSKENGNKATLTNEKRKTQDDNAVCDPHPRVIGLRGSDFTGLGIELCGGLKEGIFVRKVMPQGPATGLVNVGDKITSITIDFNHLVLEDAVSILSYASPYNVRLELVDAKANVAAMSYPNSPKSNTSTLSHPLYRSGSQSDVNTIERNSRKNLFPEEKDTNAQQKSPKPAKAHKENEIKAKASSLTKQFRDMIEEKFQNKSYVIDSKHTKDEVDNAKPATTPPASDEKKGLKFGIRVLPMNMNEKLFGKSPNKVQADNENNVNLEKSSQEMSKPAASVVVNVENSTFQRQLSINSSGIKRDAAGIPQEMPEHMMQAALSAKDNRRGNAHDKSKGSKGKAPKPPPVEIDMNVSTETMDTTIDINSPRPVEFLKVKDQMNFTDNFNELNDSMDRPSNSSTPKSNRKKQPSDTESQINARYDNDSEADERNNSSHIVELSANDITVHQSSEEEDNEENRKTASMGDLSLSITAHKSAPSSGTLERAQSLEMSENTQISIHPAAPPKKRKGLPVSDSDLSEKEPRLMVTDLDGMEQRGRLRSANEWGNLEDAISAKSSTENTNSDTESSGRMEETQSMDSSLVTEVMAVLNSERPEKKIVTEIKEVTIRMVDDIPVKTMEQLLKEKLEEAKAALETDEEDAEVPHKNGFTETITITTTTKMNGTPFKDEIDLAAETPPESLKYNEVTPDQVKMDFERNHMSDEVKVTKFPFGSLERPKSDVLKKVIARKMDYSTTMITEPQPVSLTLIGGEDQQMMADETPVYSSDNKGVNSISISSMEVNIGPPQVQTTPMGNTTVTISADRSQPSSIILIEDEKLDFTLRTPPSELDVTVAVPPVVPPMPAARNITSGQVFIVDCLSQPKVQVETSREEESNGDQLSDQDVLDALKTFVTEIDVTNNNNNISREDEERASKLALMTTEKFLEHEKHMATRPRTESSSPAMAPLPRNSEIKFTTSTYESSSSPKTNGGERRHSAHVDQIRSTFERNSSNSEIPVPVRKSSIPTLKLSPSKIPVFNTNGGGGSTTSISSTKTSTDQTSPPTQRYSLTRKSPSPTAGNRDPALPVSVTLTSIKNSARNPSGK